MNFMKWSPVLSILLFTHFSANALIELRGDKELNDNFHGRIQSVGFANSVTDTTRVVLNIVPLDKERYGESVQALFTENHYHLGMALSPHIGKIILVMPVARGATANFLIAADRE